MTALLRSHMKNMCSGRVRVGNKFPSLEISQTNRALRSMCVSVEADLEPEVAQQIQEVAASLGVSMAEYLGSVVEYPISELAYTFKYGEPLVRPELLKILPTKM